MAEDVTKASLQAELYNHQACKSESVACKNVKPSICTFLKKKNTFRMCAPSYNKEGQSFAVDHPFQSLEVFFF